MKIFGIFKTYWTTDHDCWQHWMETDNQEVYFDSHEKAESYLEDQLQRYNRRRKGEDIHVHLYMDREWKWLGNNRLGEINTTPGDQDRTEEDQEYYDQEEFVGYFIREIQVG